MGHFSAAKNFHFSGMRKIELNFLQFCGKVFPIFCFSFGGGGLIFFFRRGKVHITVLCKPISSPSQVNSKTQQSWLSLLN